MIPELRARSSKGSDKVEIDARIHGRPRVGETRSGDAGFVRRVDGVTWVLLVDALGHGPLAADAAELALDEAGAFEAELSIDAGLRRLHTRLVHSRGAAAALLRFEAGRVSLGGVGNVELRTLVGPALPYVPANGVLGHRVPRMRSTELELSGTGRVLLFTDGIERCAPLRQLGSLDPDLLCQQLIAEHSHDRDDATVIHVSYSTQIER
ncbi:hypothetical protein ENSA5_27580 [Enhygromyxa salina]|uniref:Stage II sporulation protein E (SpoIIE) n=1 Tax=Enhygromyxa salina TaxID=215803 RepID=A0A2S9Y7S6_9BACT|nr:phosphoserine phosphatase [Enhygromyxa salina]PRQ01076.1 hypothetical protein ENSA5_27580 [Enhygromyxa salina]